MEREAIQIRRSQYNLRMGVKILDLASLEGFSGYYRIKFDYNYRIGVFWDGEFIQILKTEQKQPRENCVQRKHLGENGNKRDGRRIN